jgi:hypothetical protein
MRCQIALKRINQPSRRTRPIEEASGIAIARRPQIKSRIPQRIDQPLAFLTLARVVSEFITPTPSFVFLKRGT